MGEVVEEWVEFGDDGARRRRSHSSRLDEIAPPLVPDGCTTRKYQPPGKAPFWIGKLPPGVTDDKGKMSFGGGWGARTGKTEEDVCAEITEWVWNSCG